MHRKDPQNIQFHLSREEMDLRKREGQPLPDPDGESKTYVDEDGNLVSADMSQVAPDGAARKTRRNMFKRKTKQVHMMDEQKRKLRYEEYYPWVIEDYNASNVFVGSYEAGLTETTQVLFVFDKDGFKLVPVEKVYRFTQRNKYATLTLEEAEARMEKNSAAPRWLMKHMNEESEEASSSSRFTTGFSAPRRPGGVGAQGSAAGSSSARMRTVQGGIVGGDRDSDHDDLDFDEEFADDEEAPIMDGDEEENKLLEKKIKKEMLKAAHLGGDASDADDSDDDLNDLFEVEKLRKVDKEGRKLKKVLHKNEGGVYDSDDDNQNTNPYVSASDLESDLDSDLDPAVKAEPEDDNLEPAVRRITVKTAQNGFVVIRAPKSFLASFPPGEWNPNAKKRPQMEPSTLATKKARPASALVLPAPDAIGDLDDAGANGELVTVSEVVGIVRSNPITTKELLAGLKGRISAHRDNRGRVIAIVKRNLKLVDGKLRLKE